MPAIIRQATLLVFMLGSLHAGAQAQWFEGVSWYGDGSALGGGHFQCISANGRHVAFAAYALVPADTNGLYDIYVRDRDAGRTVLISRGFDGSPANGDSRFSALSADGRYVAFSSKASNLVPDDLNGFADVFFADRDLDGDGEFDEGYPAIRRASVATDGTEGLGDSAWYGASGSNYFDGVAISDDGYRVAFASMAVNLTPNWVTSPNVYVHDWITNTTTMVSVNSNGQPGDDASGRLNATSFYRGNVAISGDGRHVAFHSEATNLAPDDTNQRVDVFVHDIDTGQTERASIGTNGEQANWDCVYPAVSSDGRFVSFNTAASSLGFPALGNRFLVRDRMLGTLDSVNEGSGRRYNLIGQKAALSGDGRFLAVSSNWFLQNDSSFRGTDTVVFDRVTRRTIHADNNWQADSHPAFDAPAMSADGKTIVFTGEEDLLPNVPVLGGDPLYLRDLSACYTYGPCDLNCDGDINFLDIDPFVLALFEPAAYELQYPACDGFCAADTNVAHGVTFEDIDGFIACLFGE